MKILVTGATGFIGSRLIGELTSQGHEVVALKRSDCDLVSAVPNLPIDLDVAYYLVHGMTKKHTSLIEVEQRQVENFIAGIKQTKCRHIVYLGGLASAEVISNHLKSRLNVETCLINSGIPLTILRASIIVGEGSASFEMIRYLTERLPIMITPKWVSNRSQPISIKDVLFYLTAVIHDKKCLNQTFDIGGPDILSFKQMLVRYAKTRKLHRLIFSVPFVALKPSYLWVALFSPANPYLAKSLVHSLRQEFVCSENHINTLIPHKCQTYKESVATAFKVFPLPEFGVHKCEVTTPFTQSKEAVTRAIWQMGGQKEWYYMNWAWKLRGKIDRLIGGIGFRLTRKPTINTGDTLDFWRVLESDQKKMWLILFAEMLMPGEAWLHFSVIPCNNHYALKTCAIFRPKGLIGRIYWLLLYPFHVLIFRGMTRSILKKT